MSDLVAHVVMDAFRPLGTMGLIFAVCLISCIVGSVVSNNASALLLYPIVIDMAQELTGLDERQAVIVLMIASSASFLTPISGHQLQTSW